MKAFGQTVNTIIAGAAKSGTTTLHRYLAQHPNVCTHPQREMNFFLIEEEFIQGYTEVFPRYFSECTSSTESILAKSAGLMYIPQAVERLSQHNPGLRLIFLLRNPVDRAYSAYWFARRRGWETAATFETALASNQGRLHRDWEQKLDCSYLEQGKYVVYLPRFIAAFGQKQVCIYLLEDLRQNAQYVCQQIFYYMGLNADIKVDVTRQHNRAAMARSFTFAHLLASRSSLKRIGKNILPVQLWWPVKKFLMRMNEKSFQPPSMNEETRDQLTSYFRPYNQQLATFIGRDLSHWGK